MSKPLGIEGDCRAASDDEGRGTYQDIEGVIDVVRGGRYAGGLEISTSVPSGRGFREVSLYVRRDQVPHLQRLITAAIKSVESPTAD